MLAIFENIIFVVTIWDKLASRKVFHRIPYEWATRHNLKLNQAKSKEIVLSLNKTPVPAATCLTRVESLTVLGITFNSKLRFEPHISYITHSAARCLYGLKTLRAHGLSGKSLGCHSGYTDCKDPICCPSMVGIPQHSRALSRSLIKRSATATYQVALKMYIVLSIIWNLNSSIVFCLIRGMSCINYYLLKRILDIACGNVLITLLCLSPMIIWSGRIFCTECYLRIPIRCMCRCMFYLLVLCANWLILVYRIFLIRWICSFLTDRQQCVKLRDVFSSWVQLSGSMPQGSY